MKSKTIHFLSFLFPCLFACSIGHAYEQDNWYLAKESAIALNSSIATGLAYYENNSTAQLYVCNDRYDNSKISVYDLNGSLARNITIANNRYTAYDIVLDDNGTIYISEYFAVTCLANDGTFLWRTGKNASISNSTSDGSGNGEFYEAKGITLGPDGNLYVADCRNHRVQVLDKNGSFIRKFGTQGSAPGEFSSPSDLDFLSDGTLVVADRSYLHYFQSDGNFIKRVNVNNAKISVSVAYDDTIFSYGIFRDRDGNQIVNPYFATYSNDRIFSVFSPSGDLFTSEAYHDGSNWHTKLAIWKRAFRTKGQAVSNVIPQPAIRSVSQRSGTNILDLDFEIIDSDDATATVGILAYAEDTRILPQAWTDGTASKIGVPIATNQVHRVSWDVKQDWTTSTGEIKFEILCQDANRTMPIDLHFLTLPLPDGNLTISRSPLKDSDFLNFFKYQVGTRSNEVAWDASSSSWTDGNATTFTNTNNQVTADGRNYLMSKLGHRYATTAEVTKAKEAATPGSVNTWSASRPIKPRNLPAKVNEYGFDSNDHGSRAWWVVKE